MRKTIFILMSILLISHMPITVYAGISIFDRGPSERKRARTNKSSALKKAEKAFIKGEYEEALRIGSSYLTYCARPDEEMQYLMGKALLKLKRFDEARNRFSRILNDSDDYRFLDRACIGLADSYYIEGNYKKAREHYEETAGHFPDSDDMHVIYSRLGDCCSKLNDKAASKKYYDKLLELYPHSFEAKLLMDEGSDFITYSVQVGSFKKWNTISRINLNINEKNVI